MENVVQIHKGYSGHSKVLQTIFPARIKVEDEEINNILSFKNINADFDGFF